MDHSLHPWSNDLLVEIVYWLPLQIRAKFEIVSQQCQAGAYSRHPRLSRFNPVDIFGSEWEFLQWAAKRRSLLAEVRELTVRPPLNLSILPGILTTLFLQTTTLQQLKVSLGVGIASAVFEKLAQARPLSLRILRMQLIKNSTTTFSTQDGEFFAKMDPDAWAAFPRLEHLFIDPADRCSASPALLTGIATHLSPTLRVLCILADDWSPLKTMEKLTDLYVYTSTSKLEFVDSADLDRAVSLQRQVNPPGVGIHLHLCHLGDRYSFQRPFNSLMRDFLDRGKRADATLLRRLVAAGLNLAHPFFFNPSSGSSPATLAQHLFNSQYKVGSITRKVIEAMIDQGLPLTWVADARRHSLFADALRSCDTEWGWPKFADWFFGAPWTDALARNTAQELLSSTPGRPFLLDLTHYIGSTELVDRVSFVLDHPKLFGQQSVHQVDAKGKNLLHLSSNSTTVTHFHRLGVDWRTKNAAGRSALDHWARQATLPATGTLLLLLSDEDFLACATKFIFGGVSCELGINLISFESQPRTALPLEVFHRMFCLVPEPKWQELVVHNLQTQLRVGEDTLVVHCLTDPEVDARLRSYAELALTEPYDPDYYTQYKAISRLPMPHVLMQRTSSLETLAKFLREKLGPARFAEWRDVVDYRGRNWLRFAEQNSGHVLKRIKAAFDAETYPPIAKPTLSVTHRL